MVTIVPFVFQAPRVQPRAQLLPQEVPRQVRQQVEKTLPHPLSDTRCLLWDYPLQGYLHIFSMILKCSPITFLHSVPQKPQLSLEKAKQTELEQSQASVLNNYLSFIIKSGKQQQHIPGLAVHSFMAELTKACTRSL